MLAVISPAKTLDYETALPPVAVTTPRFGGEAATLARSAARLPQRRLRAMMGISAPLAKLNHDRFVDFADAPERPALYAFAGDVYRGLDAATLDAAAVAYAQDHLRMLSGLYGLLRPLDLMRPHRLEMGTHWAPRHAKLTDWWGDRVAQAIAEDLAEQGSGSVLNLASQEYWTAVDGRLPRSVAVVSIDFREGPERRFVSFHAKRARGLVARWVVEHRIDRAEGLRHFDSEGYRHDAEGSTPDRMLFVRG
ncbi:YaaA family protein [Sphingomonas sp.]|uniref:YaaA family protein n=1 Tax=Sphingomonas sp. TaxID=28214 RepID=UPI003CC62FAB